MLPTSAKTGVYIPVNLSTHTSLGAFPRSLLRERVGLRLPSPRNSDVEYRAVDWLDIKRVGSQRLVLFFFARMHVLIDFRADHRPSQWIRSPNRQKRTSDQRRNWTALIEIINWLSRVKQLKMQLIHQNQNRRYMGIFVYILSVFL